MKVDEVKENEDGSVTLSIDFEEGEVARLLEFAVVELFKRYIKELEDATH